MSIIESILGVESIKNDSNDVNNISVASNEATDTNNLNNENLVAVIDFHQEPRGDEENRRGNIDHMDYMSDEGPNPVTYLSDDERYVVSSIFSDEVKVEDNAGMRDDEGGERDDWKKDKSDGNPSPGGYGDTSEIRNESIETVINEDAMEETEDISPALDDSHRETEADIVRDIGLEGKKEQQQGLDAGATYDPSDADTDDRAIDRAADDHAEAKTESESDDINESNDAIDPRDEKAEDDDDGASQTAQSRDSARDRDKKRRVSESRKREDLKSEDKDKDKRPKKDNYWPSQRCKVPFDVREMSYAQYVEKHYSLMREQMWTNHMAGGMGMGGGSGPHGAMNPMRDPVANPIQVPMMSMMPGVGAAQMSGHFFSSPQQMMHHGGMGPMMQPPMIHPDPYYGMGQGAAWRGFAGGGFRGRGGGRGSSRGRYN